MSYESISVKHKGWLGGCVRSQIVVTITFTRHNNLTSQVWCGEGEARRRKAKDDYALATARSHLGSSLLRFVFPTHPPYMHTPNHSMCGIDGRLRPSREERSLDCNGLEATGCSPGGGR